MQARNPPAYHRASVIRRDLNKASKTWHASMFLHGFQFRNGYLLHVPSGVALKSGDALQDVLLVDSANKVDMSVSFSAVFCYEDLLEAQQNIHISPKFQCFIDGCASRTNGSACTTGCVRRRSARPMCVEHRVLHGGKYGAYDGYLYCSEACANELGRVRSPATRVTQQEYDRIYADARRAHQLNRLALELLMCYAPVSGIAGFKIVLAMWGKHRLWRRRHRGRKKQRRCTAVKAPPSGAATGSLLRRVMVNLPRVALAELGQQMCGAVEGTAS